MTDLYEPCFNWEMLDGRKVYRSAAEILWSLCQAYGILVIQDYLDSVWDIVPKYPPDKDIDSVLDKP